MTTILKYAIIVLINFFLFANAYANNINIGVIIEDNNNISFNRHILNSISDLYKSSKIDNNIVFHEIHVRLDDISLTLSSINKMIHNKNCDIIIGPFIHNNYYTSNNFIDFCLDQKPTLFIIPLYTDELYHLYKNLSPSNIFIHPMSIDKIVIKLNELLTKYDFKIENIKPSLFEIQDLKINEYQVFKKKMIIFLNQAIANLEKKTSISVKPDAIEYFEKYYVNDTMWYATTLTNFTITEEWIKSTTLDEITSILTTYYEITNNTEVTAKSTKNSGINGCKSPPCKKKCCYYYKDNNHDCLNKINCD